MKKGYFFRPLTFVLLFFSWRQT